MRRELTWASILAALSLCLIFTYDIYVSPGVKREDAQEIWITIPEGLSTREIAEKLRDEGVIEHSLLFVLLAKLTGVERNLPAGRFRMELGMSEIDCVRTIAKGGVTSLAVTIPEGYTIRDIAMLLTERLEIDTGRFISLCSDDRFVKELGLEGKTLEGYLFPDTYEFGWGCDEAELAKVMVRRFNAVFAQEWQERTMTSLLPYETLILASIVEGEAMRDDERALIAAVFFNRLRLKRPLQADPTIQYLLKGHRRRILYRDLEIDSPYNTYLYTGLPPSPICSPGRASIRAALNPAHVDYLYFVAKGNGGHLFSKTLEEHNRAKKELKQTQR